MEGLVRVRRTRTQGKKGGNTQIKKQAAGNVQSASPIVQKRKINKTPSKAFQCKQCDAKYSRQVGLDDHMRAVHEGTPFNCVQCEKSYTSRRGLEEHKRAVHDKRHRYTCEKCSQGFMMKTDFETHVNSHDKIKHFKCESCNSLYSCKKTLDKHSKSCKNIGKPTPSPNCFVCKALSSRPDVLKEHIERIHKVQT